MWCKLFRIQYAPHLRSKNYQTTSMNPASHELSKSTKSLTNLIYFIFYFVKFLGQNCSIFNNSCVVGLKSKHYETTSMHPYSLRASQQYQGHSGGNMVWRILNVTNKTNKLPSLINRCYHQFFSFAKFIQSEKEGKKNFTRFLFLKKFNFFFGHIWTLILVWYHFLN